MPLEVLAEEQAIGLDKSHRAAAAPAGRPALANEAFEMRRFLPLVSLAPHPAQERIGQFGSEVGAQVSARKAPAHVALAQQQAVVQARKALAEDRFAQRLNPLALGIPTRFDQWHLEELAFADVLDEARHPGLGRFESARQLHDQHLGGLQQRLAAGLLQVVIPGQASGRVDGRLLPAFKELTVEVVALVVADVKDDLAAELGHDSGSERNGDRLSHTPLKNIPHDRV